MICRTHDVGRINEIIRDPSIWPHVSLGHEFSIDPLILDEQNVFLLHQYGCFGFIHQDECLYEQHTAFLPEGRGGPAFEAGKEALEYMFRKTDCLGITSYVILANEAACRYARKLGFKEVGDCTIADQPARALFMTVKDWVCLG